MSLAVGETHGQEPSNKNAINPEGGEPHLVAALYERRTVVIDRRCRTARQARFNPFGVGESLATSFPWVSPTANDIEPLRGPP